MTIATRKSKHAYLNSIDVFPSLLQGADHIDIKTIEGDESLREFAAKALSYQPAWVTFLYRIRWGFVRLLGMKQEGVPSAPQLKPEDILMTPGEKAVFFTVQHAKEDSYLFTDIEESHLKAGLGIVAEPLPNGRNRFYVITLVYYKHWTGKVYFNVIRPFHHLVVGMMVRAGVK